MNWRDKIVADWPDDIQKGVRGRSLLADLERTLGELAGMGHPLHVEEGYVPPPPPGWPRAMFHLYQGARVIHCQADLDELGDDWYPTMEEARHAAGMTKQMQRGGIFSKAMPSLLSQTPQELARRVQEDHDRREQQKQFVADARLANRAAFQGNAVLIDHGKEPEHEPTYQEAIERLRGSI